MCVCVWCTAQYVAVNNLRLLRMIVCVCVCVFLWQMEL